MELITTTGGEAAADALLACARVALGHDVALAGPPQAAVGGFGAGVYACRLAGDLPWPWCDPVLVRMAGSDDLRRERHWHDLCRSHGFRVPAVLGVVEGDGGAARGAIVLARGPSLSLMEALGRNPTAIPVLLRSMAVLHARVHRLPVDDAPAMAAAAPLDDLDRVLAAAGLSQRYARERAWLDAHAPATTRLVVCHGDVQPASVRLEPDDPASAQLVNWSRALVADPEYDLALTLLMFWSAPYLAEGIGQRKMMKTVRAMITDGYRTAYEATPGSPPLDDDRLRYWAVFHVLGWTVRLAAAEAAGGPADAWDPVALVQHVASYRKDLDRRFARLTRG